MIRMYFENAVREIPRIGIEFNGTNRLVHIISVGRHCNEACGHTPVLIGFDDGSSIECPTGVYDTDSYQLQFQFEELEDDEGNMYLTDILEVTYLTY